MSARWSPGPGEKGSLDASLMTWEMSFASKSNCRVPSGMSYPAYYPLVDRAVARQSWTQMNPRGQPSETHSAIALPQSLQLRLRWPHTAVMLRIPLAG